MPCIFVGGRVVGVPTEHHHSAAPVMSYGSIAHRVEIHAVEVFLLAVFNASEVEAHHGRVVAAHVAHIAPSGLVVPRMAVHQIVLMAEEVAFLAQTAQGLHKHSSLLVVTYLSCGTAGKQAEPGQ